MRDGAGHAAVTGILARAIARRQHQRRQLPRLVGDQGLGLLACRRRWVRLQRCLQQCLLRTCTP